MRVPSHPAARRVLAALLLAAALGALPVPAFAQPSGPPASGARVRFRTDSAGDTWVQGTLLGASRDSLWLRRQASGDTLVMERAQLRRIQAFAGRTSNAVKGAEVGVAVGAAVGFGLLLEFSSGAHKSTGEVLFATGLVGAAGGLVGALVGSGIKSDRWTDVGPLGVSIRVSRDSMRFGVGVGSAQLGLSGFNHLHRGSS